jgi:hypothetical protein
MAESISEELQRENAELRERLDQLGKLLNSVFEPRMLLDYIGPETKSRKTIFTIPGTARSP